MGKEHVIGLKLSQELIETKATTETNSILDHNDSAADQDPFPQGKPGSVNMASYRRSVCTSVYNIVVSIAELGLFSILKTIQLKGHLDHSCEILLFSRSLN